MADTLCLHCGKIHSDWLGCDQAIAMGEVREVTQNGPIRLEEDLMEVVRKRIDVSEKKFDRVAAMAHARSFRKKKA